MDIYIYCSILNTQIVYEAFIRIYGGRDGYRDEMFSSYNYVFRYLITQGVSGNMSTERVSEKNFVSTLILCVLLGGLGVHRFYVGKVGTGIFMLLTLGGLGIWALVDLIRIAIQKFEDGDGAVIKA